MQQNVNKFIATTAASLLAASSLVNADTQSPSAPSDMPNQMTSGIVNPSGRPQVKEGADLFLTADWLIWQANETGLGFCIKTDTSSTSALGEGSAHSAEFDWESGFRVGFGYNMGHDSWDLYLNWTWFQDDGSEHVHTDGDDFIYPSVMHPGSSVTATEAESHVDLHLNVLDLEMGREFYVSKWLTLRPHAGLRSAWVHQTNNIEYENLFSVSQGTLLYNEYEVERECNYWGMGIRTGLDTQWGLGKGWSIYGNAAISLLYGFFHVEHEEERTPSSTGVEVTLIDLTNSYRAGRAVTDLQLGLRWDHMFCKDRFHFGIQAGWEHHMFFSQNQFMTFVDDITDGIFVQNQGDLELQGWTLAARFDF